MASNAALDIRIPSDVQQIEGIVAQVVRRCREAHFNGRQLNLNVSVALTEALSNAILRGNGEDAVSYPSEEVAGVLRRTLGVPIFQEQVMQLAIVAAGFTPGEADQLRRSMAAWKRRGGMEHYRQRIIEGMT